MHIKPFINNFNHFLYTIDRDEPNFTFDKDKTLENEFLSYDDIFNKSNDYKNKAKEIKFILTKKRGRKGSNKNGIYHSGNDNDNIRTKIQVHFLNFIVDFFNDIINDLLNKKKYFPKFAYSTKNNVKYEYTEQLKQSVIKDIFEKLQISRKYKKNVTPNMKQKLSILTKNESLDDLLKINYLMFFLIYYNNNKPLYEVKINEKTIKLSNQTKSCYFLINKYKKDEEYFNRIIKMDYLDKIYSENELDLDNELNKLDSSIEYLEI